MHAKWESLLYPLIILIYCVFFFSSSSSSFTSFPTRWQSSSSAVLFIHSSRVMGILLPSFKEAMCFTERHSRQEKTRWFWDGGGGEWCGAALVWISFHVCVRLLQGCIFCASSMRCVCSYQYYPSVSQSWTLFSHILSVFLMRHKTFCYIFVHLQLQYRLKCSHR